MPSCMLSASKSNGIMIDCHFGVISRQSRFTIEIHGIDFHDVTTWDKICALGFVSLSGCCPPSFVITSLDLGSAVDLRVRGGGRLLALHSSTSAAVHSLCTRNDRGLEGSVLPSADQP